MSNMNHFLSSPSTPFLLLPVLESLTLLLVLYYRAPEIVARALAVISTIRVPVGRVPLANKLREKH
jgi:hypothetical protein